MISEGKRCKEMGMKEMGNGGEKGSGRKEKDLEERKGKG